MVITYKKNDALEYLIFNLQNSPSAARPFIDNFNILKPATVENIEL